MTGLSPDHRLGDGAVSWRGTLEERFVDSLKEAELADFSVLMACL